MDAVLSAVKCQFALVYLDGIVVFSRATAKRIDQVKHVGTVLRGIGVILKLKKCCFLTGNIEYLRHIICASARRLETASRTMDTQNLLKAPWIALELKFFFASVTSSDGSCQNLHNKRVHLSISQERTSH